MKDTLRAESPSIFLDNLSRKIEGDSARRVNAGGYMENLVFSVKVHGNFHVPFTCIVQECTSLEISMYLNMSNATG